MPTPDNTKSEAETILNTDTPEKKECRVRDLMQAGATREQAELIDSEAFDITETTFRHFFTRLEESTKKRPEIAPLLSCACMTMLHGNAELNLTELYNFINHGGGLRVVEINSVEELDALIRRILGGGK